jgi:LPXTG-motif cell wall-anchored protein
MKSHLNYFADINSGCVKDPETSGCAIGPGCDSESTTCHPISQTENNYSTNNIPLLLGIGLLILIAVAAILISRRRKLKK